MTTDEPFGNLPNIPVGYKNGICDLRDDPESFSSWMGPDGAEMTFLSTNIVEGGTSFGR